MLDMIALAASDSLLMFFVFNVIVLAVIFGSKPCSGFDQEVEGPYCGADDLYTHTSTSVKQNTDICKELDIKEAPLYVSNDYSDDLGAPSDSGSSVDGFSSDFDDSDSESSSDDSGEEDDELKRRVEEFIDRVNSGWKAELVTTSHMVYT